MTACEVAIVGAGPVGLALANLLGRRGVSVTVLERQPAPYPLPRAIHLDGEAMRILQATGLADAVLPHTHVGAGMLFRDPSGATLIDWSRDPAPGPMGWHESYRFHQPGLERVLEEGLGRFAHVTLRRGTGVTALTQDAGGVTLALSDGGTCRARFAVACDGAQSDIRRLLGVGWSDLGFQERWLVADLILTRPRPDLGDHTVQYCHAERPATYGRGVGERRRWEIRLAAGDPDRFAPDRVWSELSRWIAPQDARLERHAVYTFRSGVAEDWRRGGVLLAGDAAHLMPPFMGQGLCAGLRDAANLAWKLAAVLRGSDAALLDTYQSERAPNVRAFIDRSVALGRLINQTDPNRLPKGRMRSIWPDLGPGLGPRDGIGGTLVPQGRTQDGALADDAAFPGFHVLSDRPLPGAPLPVFAGGRDWLARRGIAGVIVRPDGYALAGFSEPSGLPALAAALPVLA